MQSKLGLIAACDHLVGPLQGLLIPLVGPFAQSLVDLGHNWDLLTAVTEADLIFRLGHVSHKPQYSHPYSQRSLHGHKHHTMINQECSMRRQSLTIMSLL